MDLVLASRVLPRYIPHQAMDFGNEKQKSAVFLAMVPPVEWQRTVLCVRTCMCMYTVPLRVSRGEYTFFVT